MRVFTDNKIRPDGGSAHKSDSCQVRHLQLLCESYRQPALAGQLQKQSCKLLSVFGKLSLVVHNTRTYNAEWFFRRHQRLFISILAYGMMVQP